jgi:hypothetical protein
MDSIEAEMVRVFSDHVAENFSVKIIAPIEMGPIIFNISLQEILVSAVSIQDQPRVIYKLLSSKIIEHYNRQIEDFPIMDMLNDPSRYKRLYNVEWKSWYF